MTPTCTFCEEHDYVNDVPVGPPCGKPATHVIVWLDGSRRYSPACSDHLELEPDAPPHEIRELESVHG